MGKLQRLLTSSTERPHTPRVDWKALRERHGIELNIEQPSTLVVLSPDFFSSVLMVSSQMFTFLSPPKAVCNSDTFWG